MRFYDIINMGTSMQSYSDNMHDWFEEATSAFVHEFGIRFELVTVEYNSKLDLDSACIVDEEHLNNHCTSQCGPISSCSNVHHTGASRLLEIDGSDEYYTIRIVGYGICSYDEDNLTHYGYAGRAYTGGHASVVSYSYSQNILTATMQHELSHNLGAGHTPCLDEDCALVFSMNEWCNVCKQAINSNFD